MVKIFLLLVAIILINGCASRTVDLMPKKPSENIIAEYNEYSCNQIKNKLSFNEKKAQRLARVQNDNAKTDRALIPLGLLSLFFLEGDGEVKEQFELVLGEKEVLEEIAIKKDCKFESIEYHHTFEGTY